MQVTVYKCDHCKKEIGAKTHITLNLNTQHSTTGIAVRDLVTGTWRVHDAPRNFIHFHDGKCIGAYFDGLLKQYDKKTK